MPAPSCPPPTLSRRVRRVACAGALLTVLTGCSSDGLDVDGFAAGPCTEAAGALQDVDEALRQVEDEDLEPGAAGMRFSAAQDVLGPVADGDGAAAGPVRELVTQLGFFRISVDSNSYDGTQGDDVRAALDGVVEACTG